MFDNEKQEIKSLLKRCAANDRAAQEEFANRSFLNTIQRTILGVIDEHGARSLFSREDLEALVTICVWDSVYRRADEIVDQGKDFRESLRRVAIAVATRYLYKKAKVR